jgi:hypothetical protein
MLVCWVASYTLLPTLMLRFGRNTKIYYGSPFVGSTLVRFLGFRRSKIVVLVAIALFAGSGLLVARYIKADPFEYNIRNLRSEGADAIE